MIDAPLQLIINHWKSTASMTNGANTRAHVPYKKNGKNKYTIKTRRPLSVEKILLKLYQSIINHRINQHLYSNKILSIYQYACKKGVGAEDCIISITDHVHHQLMKCIPSTLATFDCGDAYDAQQQLFIYDKFRCHAGFDDESIIMLQSLLIGRKSKCILNGMHSNAMNIISGPYQGASPTATTWGVYFKPLLMHIEKNCIIFDSHESIIAAIKPHVYMDDLSIVTNILKEYPTITINGRKTQQIPKHVQHSIDELIQYTIDIMTLYFSIKTAK